MTPIRLAPVLPEYSEQAPQRNTAGTEISIIASVTDTGERQSFGPLAVAAFLWPLGQGVLQHWMPLYLAAGIACCVCFGCAGVHVSREPRARVLVGAIVGGAFAAAVHYVWPL